MLQESELGRLLLARRKLYSAGIPLRLMQGLRADFHAFGAPHSGVACLVQANEPETFLASPEGQLLSAALEKGLKLAPNDVLILVARTVETLRQRCAVSAPIRCVIAFGSEVSSVVDQFPGAQQISTISLGEVVRSSDKKKLLWKDLQCAVSSIR